MNSKFNILFYIFILIFPLFIWVDFRCYCEFLIISLVIKYSTTFLLQKFILDRKLFLFKDSIQIVYSLLILIFYFYSLTSDRTLDITKLLGDSISYYQDALRIESADQEQLGFWDLKSYVRNNYFFYQVVLSSIFSFFEHKLLAGFLFSAFIGIVNFLFNAALSLFFGSPNISICSFC